MFLLLTKIILYNHHTFQFIIFYNGHDGMFYWPTEVYFIYLIVCFHSTVIMFMLGIDVQNLVLTGLLVCLSSRYRLHAVYMVTGLTYLAIMCLLPWRNNCAFPKWRHLFLVSSYVTSDFAISLDISPHLISRCTVFQTFTFFLIFTMVY